MREIKFRAWDKKLKKWVARSKEGFNLFGECTLIGGILENNYYTHNVFEKLYSDVEVMQYTGLKDKNSKEIYESDLIKVPEMVDDDDKPIKEWTGKVVFTCGSFMIQHLTINQWEDIDISGLEIIGNIYERERVVLNRRKFLKYLPLSLLGLIPASLSRKETVEDFTDKEIAECIGKKGYATINKEGLEELRKLASNGNGGRGRFINKDVVHWFDDSGKIVDKEVIAVTEEKEDISLPNEYRTYIARVNPICRHVKYRKVDKSIIDIEKLNSSPPYEDYMYEEYLRNARTI